MSFAQWTKVRDAIKTTLETVPGISIVQPYPRLAPDKQSAKWLTWVRDRSRINAWTILREQVDTNFGTSKQVFITTQVLLIGMLQHSDEKHTQDEFDEILDLVLQTFFKNVHLEMPEIVDIQGPANLRLEELRLVSDTAIHYAEIGLSVQQTIRA